MLQVPVCICSRASSIYGIIRERVYKQEKNPRDDDDDTRATITDLSLVCRCSKQAAAPLLYLPSPPCAPTTNIVALHA